MGGKLTVDKVGQQRDVDHTLTHSRLRSIRVI